MVSVVVVVVAMVVFLLVYLLTAVVMVVVVVFVLCCAVRRLWGIRHPTPQARIILWGAKQSRMGLRGTR